MHKKVFVDTSVFVGNQFDFGNKLFETLIEHAQAERIDILLPEITVREIRGKADEIVEEAIQGLQKAVQKGPVLRSLGSPYAELHDKIDLAQTKGKIQSNIDEFLKKAKVKVLPTPGDALKFVMDDYYGRKPPFGQGKKKSEFPDAFAAATLKKWSEDNDEDVVIISTDGDFRGICDGHPRLHHEERLEKYLQEVGEFHAALLSYVKEVTNQHREKIEDAIEERFTQLGFYLEDQDGEVENVQVMRIAFDDDFFVIRIKDENEATLELSARVEFTCDLNYDDMSTAIWDSEDKRYIYIDRVSEDDVEREEEVPVEVQVSFDLGDKTYFEIEELEVNRGKDIGVMQDTDYPYK